MTLFFPQSEDRENSATKHIYTLGLVAFIKSPAGITSYRWQHVRGFRRSHETCKSKRWGTRVESKGFDFAPAPGPPSLVGSRPRAARSHLAALMVYFSQQNVVVTRYMTTVSFAA